jgi:hypothetical protein
VRDLVLLRGSWESMENWESDNESKKNSRKRKVISID